MIIYNAAEFSDYVIDNKINLVLNFCLILWNILRQAFLLLSIKSGPFFSVFFLKNITPPHHHTDTHIMSFLPFEVWHFGETLSM